MTTAEARDTAIREAKRYIRDVVRNDWCFEPSTSTTGPRFQTSWPVSEQEVAEWRLRGYDDSGSELEPQDEDEDFDESTPPPAAGERDNERRRKRRRQMEEEMSWNEGLRTWMERRDAWAGARTRKEIQERENRLRGAGGDTTINATASAAAANGAEAQNEGICDEASALAASMDISFAITEKNGDHEEGKGQQPPQPQPQPQPAQPTETNVTESEQPLEPSNHPRSDNHLLDQKASSDIPDEPFIPVVPSIISNTNPIRASISPNMYPSIYSKVIVQSLTPTVPINLADVTKAMVQGWKADGQWPTKPAPTSIVLPDDATVRRKDDTEARADKAAAAQDTKKKSGVASAVRKVLHFSGFHPHHHPFHRRGSNHSGSNSQHDGAGTGTGAGAGAGANGATEPGPSNAQ